MRTRSHAAILVVLLHQGCSAPSVPDSGLVDAPEAGVECDGQHLVFDYLMDGVDGSTGCQSAKADRWQSPSVESTSLIHDPEASPDLRAGLPPGICGTETHLYNTPLETGANGRIEHVDFIPPPDPWVARVVSGLSYSFAPSGEPDCDPPVPVPEGWQRGRATLTSGTWEVLQGGSRAGDWLEFVARNVAFAPFGDDGHTMQFPVMRWRVQLSEPMVAAGP